MLVEIDESQAVAVEHREGVKNGNEWSITTQPVWVFTDGCRYPKEFIVPIEKPYPAGKYDLDLERMLVQGSFNSLSLDSRLFELVPVTDSKLFPKK